MTDVVQLVDSKTGLKKLFIKPAENRLFDVIVSDYMRSGDSISNVGAISTSLLSGTGSLTAGSLATDYQSTLQFRASSGSDGTRHKVTIGFTTAEGDTLEADLVIEVKEDF